MKRLAQQERKPSLLNFHEAIQAIHEAPDDAERAFLSRQLLLGTLPHSDPVLVGCRGRTDQMSPDLCKNLNDFILLVPLAQLRSAASAASLLRFPELRREDLMRSCQPPLIRPLSPSFNRRQACPSPLSLELSIK